MESASQTTYSECIYLYLACFHVLLFMFLDFIRTLLTNLTDAVLEAHKKWHNYN